MCTVKIKQHYLDDDTFQMYTKSIKIWIYFLCYAKTMSIEIHK